MKTHNLDLIMSRKTERHSMIGWPALFKTVNVMQTDAEDLFYIKKSTKEAW